MMSALPLQEEGILCEKEKQYPVLFNKQLKRYRKKDLTNAWNAVAKKIKSGRCLLFLVKNNQEVWIESQAHLEPSQTSVMELF